MTGLTCNRSSPI